MHASPRHLHGQGQGDVPQKGVCVYECVCVRERWEDLVFQNDRDLSLVSGCQFHPYSQGVVNVMLSTFFSLIFGFSFLQK